ncbi:hypothetical protein J2045_003080 [Peteryoungia aggregata LMG 23059]|uniref:Uncharacterized protein n=1 Tax=Peteryoungia aggregata LMG 23059 TaxID=1368425 RepID=A0ABU0G9K8_9HYPH|nr:hypothetical protein [Peteryoungia aggregata LMG 23059]
MTRAFCFWSFNCHPGARNAATKKGGTDGTAFQIFA